MHRQLWTKSYNKSSFVCFVVCVIPTKMMYNNQGRKQFGDDLNDDESQPHRDGRERQGEVKKLDLLPLSKYISRGKSFIFVRWASMIKKTRLLWGNSFDEDLQFFALLSFMFFIFIPKCGIFFEKYIFATFYKGREYENRIKNLGSKKNL